MVTLTNEVGFISHKKCIFKNAVRTSNLETDFELFENTFKSVKRMGMVRCANKMRRYEYFPSTTGGRRHQSGATEQK